LTIPDSIPVLADEVIE